MNITTYEYRKLLKKVAKRMSRTTSRLTTTEILRMCHEEDPAPYRKHFNFHPVVV